MTKKPQKTDLQQEDHHPRAYGSTTLAAKGGSRKGIGKGKGKADRECFLCGQDGHFKAHCPNRWYVCRRPNGFLAARDIANHVSRFFTPSVLLCFMHRSRRKLRCLDSAVWFNVASRSPSAAEHSPSAPTEALLVVCQRLLPPVSSFNLEDPNCSACDIISAVGIRRGSNTSLASRTRHGCRCGVRHSGLRDVWLQFPLLGCVQVRATLVSPP